MYNRYVPRPDGSYQRRSAQDSYGTIPMDGKSPPPKPPAEKEVYPPPPQEPKLSEDCAGDFLKNLLPRNIDTGDLLTILLILLISGEKEQDSTTTLLTLALYLLL